MNQPLAYVHPGAKIAKNVVIEPFTTIDNNVIIGEGTWIGPNVTIMEGARIGKNCNIFPGSIISAVPQDLKFNGEDTTAEIGNNVTIYHGVTLGGISPAIKASEQVGLKRHPTLEDEVIVGSGAQILGPVLIKSCARIGSNAVVTKDVPKGGIMVGVPAKNINSGNKKTDSSFKPYAVTKK